MQICYKNAIRFDGDKALGVRIGENIDTHKIEGILEVQCIEKIGAGTTISPEVMEQLENREADYAFIFSTVKSAEIVKLGLEKLIEHFKEIEEKESGKQRRHISKST